MSGNSTNSLDGFGTAVAACVVVTSNLYVGLWAFNWTYLMFTVIGFSILIFFLVVLGLAHFLPALGSIDVLLFTNLNFWIVLGFTVTACLLPRFIARFIHSLFFPNDSDIIREQVLIFRHYIRQQSRRLRQKRRKRRIQPLLDQSTLLGRLFSASKDKDHTGYAFSMDETSVLSKKLQESLLRSHIETTEASAEHAAELTAMLDYPLESTGHNESNLDSNLNTDQNLPQIRITPPSIKRENRPSDPESSTRSPPNS